MSNRVSSSSSSSSPRTMRPAHDETEAASEESASLDDPKKGPKGKESEYKPKTSNLGPDTLKVGTQLADKLGPQFSTENLKILKRLRIDNLSDALTPAETAALRGGCASYCQHVITTTIPWAKTAGQRPSLREGCIAVAAYSCWYILPKLLQNFIEPLNKSLGLAAFVTLAPILNALTSPDLAGQDARRYGGPLAPDIKTDEDRISLLAALVSARVEGNPDRERVCNDLLNRLVDSVEERVKVTHPPFAFDNALRGVYVRRIISDLVYLTWAVALAIPAAVQPQLNEHLGSSTWALKAADAGVSVVSGLVIGGLCTWMVRRLVVEYLQKAPPDAVPPGELLTLLDMRIDKLQTEVGKLKNVEDQLDALTTALAKGKTTVAREIKILHPGEPQVNRGVHLWEKLAGDMLGGVLSMAAVAGVAYQFSSIYGAMGTSPAASFGGSYNGTHNATSEGLPGDIAGVTEMTAGLFMVGAMYVNRWFLGPVVRLGLGALDGAVRRANGRQQACVAASLRVGPSAGGRVELRVGLSAALIKSRHARPANSSTH